MVGVGLIGLISKLHIWDDSAMFFDGSCLGPDPSMHHLFVTALIAGFFHHSGLCIQHSSLYHGDDSGTADDSYPSGKCGYP